MSMKRWYVVFIVVVFITAALHGNNKDLPVPNNFTVFADTMKIGISWDPPDENTNHFVRYDLYRSDIGKYFSFEEIPSSVYYDYMVEFEEYSYYIKAVYWEGESAPTDILSITPFYDSFLVGTVLVYTSDNSGNPVENARIILDGSNDISYSILTDNWGSAAIHQVRLGSYDIDHYHPCYNSYYFPYSITFDLPGVISIDPGFGSSYLTTIPSTISHSIDIGTTDSISLCINNISDNSYSWVASIINNSYPSQNWITLNDSTGAILENDQVELKIYFDATAINSNITCTCEIGFRENFETNFAVVSVTLDVTGYSIDGVISELYQSVYTKPNPFVSSTTISYYVKNSESLSSSLLIYNIKGQLVREVMNEESKQGSNEVEWDGKNNEGKVLAPGLYFYQIKVGDKIIGTSKCLFLK